MFIGDALPHTEHDTEKARALATLVVRSPRSIEAYLDFCRVEARGLLIERRKLVVAIAIALIKRETLSSAEIDEIIKGA